MKATRADAKVLQYHNPIYYDALGGGLMKNDELMKMSIKSY